MTVLVVTYVTESPNSLIRSSRWNQNFTDLTTFMNNNNIDSTDNIKAAGIGTAALANLAVTDAKIAGIVTAGKVDGASLTNLANTSSGAGLLPTANIPVGTTANKIVQLDSSAKIPALDGSQLTNLNPTGLGAWVVKSANTVYQATTDGFVVGSVANGAADLLSDSSNPPITRRCPTSSTAERSGFCMPVRKNDYWKVTQSSGTVDFLYFISLGT